MDELTRRSPRKGPRDVMVTVRLRRDAVDEIDKYAETRDLRRSDAMRSLLRIALDAERGGR